MASMIFATFRDRYDAGQTVNELYSIGYSREDLSVVLEDSGDGAVRGTRTRYVSNAADGLTAGAATGGVIGGIAGLLAGAGVIPALASIFFGGLIAAALGLTGAAAVALSGAFSGAALGGLVGLLTGIGLSEDDTKYYESAIDRGDVLVGVPVSVDHHEEDVRALLADHGGEQVRLIQVSDAPLSEADDIEYSHDSLLQPAVVAYRQELARDADEMGRSLDERSGR